MVVFSGDHRITGTQGLITKPAKRTEGSAYSARIHFGASKDSPVASSAQKTCWKALPTTLVAWLSALGLGGLGVYQHGVNQELSQQNQALVEKLSQTHQEFTNYATSETLKELSGRVDQIRKVVIPTEVVESVLPATATILVKVDGEAYSSGSGVWIPGRDADEILLLTNEHVVDKAKALAEEGIPPTAISYVILQNGSEEEVPATLLHAHKPYDMALLKVEKPPAEAQATALRNLYAEPLKPGEKVFIVGAPASFRDSVTVGVISHTGRFKNGKPLPFIQIDAPVNQGNSGGGLFDNEGRLIGLNNWIYRMPPTITDGLGFAIRGDMLPYYMNQLSRFLEQEQEHPAAIPRPGRKPASSGQE